MHAIARFNILMTVYSLSIEILTIIILSSSTMHIHPRLPYKYLRLKAYVVYIHVQRNNDVRREAGGWDLPWETPYRRYITAFRMHGGSHTCGTSLIHESNHFSKSPLKRLRVKNNYLQNDYSYCSARNQRQ